MRALLISGKRGAGKDTLAVWATEYLRRHGVQTALARLAEPIKDDLVWHFDCDMNVLNGVNSEKEMIEWRTGKTYRQLMVELGCFYGGLEPRHFARLAFEKYGDSGATIVFCDVRMKCEVEYFREHCDTRVVRLLRAENPDDSSKVECSLDDYMDFDLVVDNRNQGLWYPQNMLKKALVQWRWLKGAYNGGQEGKRRVQGVREEERQSTLQEADEQAEG